MSRLLARTLLAAGLCFGLLALAAGAIVRLEMRRWENNLAPFTPPTPFAEIEPKIGERFLDFTLPMTDGVDLRLAALMGRRPVLLQFGSFS